MYQKWPILLYSKNNAEILLCFFHKYVYVHHFNYILKLEIGKFTCNIGRRLE